MIVTDTQERIRQLEAELTKSKAELEETKQQLGEKTLVLETVLESTLAGYWDWSIQEGTEYLSPTFKSMFGYEDHELPNSPDSWQKIIHPDDLPYVLECFARHVESRGAIPYDNEVRYFHKNGSIVNVMCKGEVIEWSDSGEPLRMIGSHVDITSLKNATAELQKSEERFRKTFEHAGVGMAVVGLDGKPQQANEFMQNMLNYSEAELLQMTFAEFTHPDDVDADLEQFGHLLKREIPHYRLEKRYIRRDGRTIWGDLSVSLAVDPLSGEATAAIAVIQDITARKDAEIALEQSNQTLATINEKLRLSNEELDNFAHIASHDLKEPLRAISNQAAFMLEDYADTLDEKAIARLNRIVYLSHRMTGLISDLFHYSRLNREAVNSETVDLNAIAHDVISMLELETEAYTVSVEFDTELPEILGDKVRLTELFRNLFTNAIKYNDHDNRRINIGVRPGGENPVLYVRDNGIGIAEEHREDVFRIFKRLHGPKAYGGGSGSGLTFVQRIVEQHGGKVWLESTPGEGTTVCFTLRNGQ